MEVMGKLRICKQLLDEVTENLRRKHEIVLCGEIASEEAMDLS